MLATANFNRIGNYRKDAKYRVGQNKHFPPRIRDAKGLRKVGPHLMNAVHNIAANRTNFMWRFVTEDETWVHHYTPETKRSIVYARLVKPNVFWYAKGIVLIHYLEKDNNCSWYYLNLLDQLDVKIREKKHGLKKKKIILHHNALAHKSVLANGTKHFVIGFLED